MKWNLNQKVGSAAFFNGFGAFSWESLAAMG